MSQHSVVISGTQVSEQTYVPEQKKNGQASAPQELPASIRSALSVLFQAHMYARTLRRDIWEFSLELPNLCATGLSINDLRWLTCMGYVKHAEEIISWRNKRRSFRSYSQLTFTQRTCFVLTPDGIQLARQTLKAGKTGQTQEERLEAVAADEPAAGQESADLTVLDVVPSASAADAPYGVLPHWDVDRRELRMGGVLVKRYKLPSPNQEMILTAFEEEGWPTRIDDPLPPVSKLSPKRRLHDTIKSLNRHQKSALLRFMGDGRGEGVLWEPLSPVNSTA